MTKQTTGHHFVFEIEDKFIGNTEGQFHVHAITIHNHATLKELKDILLADINMVRSSKNLGSWKFHQIHFNFTSEQASPKSSHDDQKLSNWFSIHKKMHIYRIALADAPSNTGKIGWNACCGFILRIVYSFCKIGRPNS